MCECDREYERECGGSHVRECAALGFRKLFFAEESEVADRDGEIEGQTDPELHHVSTVSLSSQTQDGKPEESLTHAFPSPSRFAAIFGNVGPGPVELRPSARAMMVPMEPMI